MEERKQPYIQEGFCCCCCFAFLTKHSDKAYTSQLNDDVKFGKYKCKQKIRKAKTELFL